MIYVNKTAEDKKFISKTNYYNIVYLKPHFQNNNRFSVDNFQNIEYNNIIYN